MGALRQRGTTTENFKTILKLSVVQFKNFSSNTFNAMVLMPPPSGSTTSSQLKKVTYLKRENASIYMCDATGAR